MNNYSTSSTNVNNQIQHTNWAEKYGELWAKKYPQYAEHYMKKSQQATTQDLPTPTAEPAPATKPQPVKRHNQPMPGRKANPDGLAIQQRYLSGELDPLHAWIACEELTESTSRHFPSDDVVARAVLTCHIAVRNGLHGELLGWKDGQARLAWVHDLEHMLELDKPTPKWIEPTGDNWQPSVIVDGVNFKHEADGSITGHGSLPKPEGFKVEYIPPFAVPHLAEPKFPDTLENTMRKATCAQTFRSVHVPKGKTSCLRTPYRCGICENCLRWKAEKRVQRRLNWLSTTATSQSDFSLYHAIISQDEHRRLIRKVSKSSLLSIPLADGRRWDVVNQPFDGGQPLGLSILEPDAIGWIAELLENTPTGARMVGLDRARGTVKIKTHAFTSDEATSKVIERITERAAKKVNYGEPQTQEQAQERADKEWEYIGPITEWLKKRGRLHFTVKETTWHCQIGNRDSIPACSLSDIYDDETPAQHIARVLASGEFKPSDRELPF